MTIISSVYVPEGIAMAADSRLTGFINRENGFTDRTTISDNAQKLVLVRHSSIGISFCGDAIIDGKTVADFLRVFDINEVESEDTVEVVSEKLNQYLAKRNINYYTEFLVAGFDNDEPYVYSVTSKDLKRINVDETGEITYGASWRGEIDPISKLLVSEPKAPLNFTLMPLKDAVDFAEFIAETAIKYFRFTDQLATCGGPIDILVITKDFTKFYRHKILQPN